MIRRAQKEESELLTGISFTSKAYWNYPQDFFEIWKNELTLRPEYIEKNEVSVVEVDGAVVGYYSVVKLCEDTKFSEILLQRGFWLEHMFILPRYMGQYLGTEMFDHLQNWCQLRGVERLNILADPNTRGFYEKKGCVYLREFPSNISQRATPYLILLIK